MAECAVDRWLFERVRKLPVGAFLEINGGDPDGTEFFAGTGRL